MLENWNLEAKSPDDFILDQIDLSHDVVYGAVQRIADSEATRRQRFLMSCACSNVMASSKVWPLYAPEGNPDKMCRGRWAVDLYLDDREHVDAVLLRS